MLDVAQPTTLLDGETFALALEGSAASLAGQSVRTTDSIHVENGSAEARCKRSWTRMTCVDDRARLDEVGEMLGMIGSDVAVVTCQGGMQGEGCETKLAGLNCGVEPRSFGWSPKSTMSSNGTLGGMVPRGWTISACKLCASEGVWVLPLDKLGGLAAEENMGSMLDTPES